MHIQAGRQGERVAGNRYGVVIQEAETSIRQADFSKAMGCLDVLVDATIAEEASLSRAAIREIINDLEGSLADIANTNSETDEILHLKARVLAKMGRHKEANLQLLKLSPAHRTGVAGRRIDIESLGIVPGTVPNRILNEWESGCVLSHLMALAEWDAVEKILPYLSMSDSQPLVRIYEHMKDKRALFSIESLRDATHAARDIPGWFSEDEVAYLANLARIVPSDRAIVEIGAYCGRSTVALAFGSSRGHRAVIQSIDPHNGLTAIHPSSTYGELIKNLIERDLLNYVAVHKTFSREAAINWNGGNIGLLFIDAEHDYDAVKSDFESWQRFIVPGTLVVFHDYPMTGPNKLIREILTSSPSFFPVAFLDSLFVLTYDPATRRQYSEVTNLFIEYLSLCGDAYNSWLEIETNKSIELALEFLGRLKSILEGVQFAR